MIGMSMGDDGPLNRPRGINIKISLATVKSIGCKFQNFVHLAGISICYEDAFGRETIAALTGAGSIDSGGYQSQYLRGALKGRCGL